MATLIVGLIVLAGAAAWASNVSEGAWLTFLENAAQPEHSTVDAEEQNNGARRLANLSETNSPVSRIAELPSRQPSRIGVTK
ncbi:MAG: hypothetical protein GY809_17915 [Planctomycetes bacterium]|nr:hypothetical protein [Planctomycetota bacterium]